MLFPSPRIANRQSDQSYRRSVTTSATGPYCRKRAKACSPFRDWITSNPCSEQILDSKASKASSLVTMRTLPGPESERPRRFPAGIMSSIIIDIIVYRKGNLGERLAEGGLESTPCAGLQ